MGRQGDEPARHLAAHVAAHALQSVGPSSSSPLRLQTIPDAQCRNAQSHDATVGLIRDALNKHYNITKVYVDTVGPPAAYQAKLQAAFPQLSFTVESKADFKYPIVGAGPFYCYRFFRFKSLAGLRERGQLRSRPR